MSTCACCWPAKDPAADPVENDEAADSDENKTQ